MLSKYFPISIIAAGVGLYYLTGPTPTIMLLFFVGVSFIIFILNFISYASYILQNIELGRISVETAKLRSMMVYPNEQGILPIDINSFNGGSYTTQIIDLATQKVSIPANSARILHVHAPMANKALIAPSAKAQNFTIEPIGLEPLEEVAAEPVNMLDTILDSDACMIIGQRGSGKTNLLQHVTATKDAEIWVGDPHDYPNKWVATKVVGGERDFMGIHMMIIEVLAELQKRATQLFKKEKTEQDFQNDLFVIIIDELLTVVQHCPDDFSIHIRHLIAESRKFGIILIVASQGAGVQALGLERHKDLKRSLLTCNLYKDSKGNRRGTVQLGNELPIPAILPSVYKAPSIQKDIPLAAEALTTSTYSVNLLQPKITRGMGMIAYTRELNLETSEEVETTVQKLPKEDNLTLPEVKEEVKIRRYPNVTHAIVAEARLKYGAYTAGKHSSYHALIDELVASGQIAIDKYKTPEMRQNKKEAS